MTTILCIVLGINIIVQIVAIIIKLMFIIGDKE